MKLKLFIFLLLANVSLTCISQRDDFRTDSILIQNTNLDITPDLALKKLTGVADLVVLARVDSVRYIRLDLLRLSIQKITSSLNIASYTYNDTIITINFSAAPLRNIPFTIHIEYSGSPMQDTRWGGWYWSGNYAFNLGVGFDAIPHNLGRAWFPGIDNFKAKSAYDIIIHTPSNLKANSNGTLISQKDSAGMSIYHYRLHEPIPSYLVSCNIGPYVFMQDTLLSIDGRILDIRIAAAPSDTQKVKITFGKLKETARFFETCFGPCPFGVIGYSLIPFISGAMEHATNIGIAASFVDGTLNYETLWAHELSHLWWGDNITCASAEEMWINEGWASYCERLFTEHFYGRKAYQKSIDDNHRYVLQFAHLTDSGYYSLDNIPQKFTYGDHSYKKGCDMIHNLRSIDSTLFFVHARDLMIQERFKSVTTDQVLKYFMQDKSCDSTSLELLFKQPRYISNKTESYELSTSALPAVDIKQATYPIGLAPAICYPVNFYILDSATDKSEYLFLKELHHNGFYHLPIAGGQRAGFVAFDYDNFISDANTSQHYWIRSAGSYDFSNEICNVSLSADLPSNDSSLLYINRSWDYTGGKVIARGIQTNSRGFWTVDGVRISRLKGAVRFYYNGAIPATTTGYEGVDLGFITQNEDSLVLLFRESYLAPWTILTSALKTAGNLTDKRGSFLVNEIRKGQYCIGQYNYIKSGIGSTGTSPAQLIIVEPNPAHGLITIRISQVIANSGLSIYDSVGRLIMSSQAPGEKIELNMSGYPAGIYFIRLINERGIYYEKFILE
jgi:hypothetical protein